MNENGARNYTYKNVTEAWMKSSGHKLNLLDSRIDLCGIGIKDGYIDFIGVEEL